MSYHTTVTLGNESIYVSKPSWHTNPSHLHLFGRVPALTATDPASAALFETQTVFGQSRTVYRWGGAASPATSQGGLTFSNAGSLLSSTDYSIELVFQFDSTSGWRRVVDVQNRASDNGFYVDPANNLDLFPVSGSSAAFAAGFHHVVMTQSAGGHVIAYLDGVQQFDAASSIMDLSGSTINLFLDNTAGGGQGEWSAGDIALARFYNGVLTAGEVTRLASDPFPIAGAPEPSTVLFTLTGLALCGLRGIRKK